MTKTHLPLIAGLALAYGCVSESPQTPADVIFLGGDIITMNVARPTAGAVAIKDGRILALGEQAAIEVAHKAPDTSVVDLAGKTLLPGFIDSHSHFNNALQVVGWANVSSPPVGPVEDIPGLIAALQAHVTGTGPDKGDWIIAYGYDANTLKEERHVTRDDLDPHFPDNPVMLIHVSNHGCVLNSAGFAAFGIDASTPTPAGGVIARKPGSQEPAGLLMERAFLPVFANMPQPTQEQKLAAFEPTQQEYARNGYTTMQEGATHFDVYETIRAGAERGLLFLDLVVLPIMTDLAAFSEVDLADNGYERRLKIGGVKVFGDGSPQGKTAFWTEPLLTEGPDGEQDWRGEPMLPYEQFEPIVRSVVGQGVRVVAHANGDAAIDMVIDSLSAAGVTAAQDRRDVVIHSQFVRADQLDRYVELGISPSFFTNHTFFWGDVHVANTGQARAYFISPLAAARDRGIRFSNHSDFSVTPLDPMMTVWTAVNRRSRSGRVIGPDQRVDAETALRALTLDAAWQNHEEASKGSIEPGKLADLVILDGNPLEVDPDAIREIEIVETLKEGRTIFRRDR